jgi:hypothetical protein
VSTVLSETSGPAGRRIASLSGRRSSPLGRIATALSAVLRGAGARPAAGQRLPVGAVALPSVLPGASVAASRRVGGAPRRRRSRVGGSPAALSAVLSCASALRARGQILVVALSVALVALGPAPETVAAVAGCPAFPHDHILNARVDALPVHPRSADYIASIGSTVGLFADFGSGLYEGAPIGIPFTTVPGTQPRVPVSFEVADESDPGPYPVPSDAPIEGGPASTGDRHVLVVDRDNCLLYELFAAVPQSDGSWTAYSGAVFDLRSHALRRAGDTSADAAGLPILAALARFEEVQAGGIHHALRFTARTTQRAFVWPARHFASSNTSPAVPPMGQRFRLKASVDISGFPPQARIILQALKTYGLILADNGSNWFINGVPDEGWDNDDLRTLRQIKGSDFEAVDVSGLTIHPESGQANLVTTSVNQLGFRSGQTFRLTVGVHNPGSPAAVDFFLGLLFPDGDTIAFVTSDGVHQGRGSDPSTFRPIATNISLATSFAVRLSDFLVHTWTGTEAPGRYLAFLAAVVPGSLADGSLDPGDLVGASVAAFDYAP